MPTKTQGWRPQRKRRFTFIPHYAAYERILGNRKPDWNEVVLWEGLLPPSSFLSLQLDLMRLSEAHVWHPQKTQHFTILFWHFIINGLVYYLFNVELSYLQGPSWVEPWLTCLTILSAAGPHQRGWVLVINQHTQGLLARQGRWGAQTPLGRRGRRWAVSLKPRNHLCGPGLQSKSVVS